MVELASKPADDTKTDQKDVDDLTKQIKDLGEERSKILRKFGHQTSNIPISHGYWSIGNQIQNLTELLKFAQANLAEDKSESKPEVKPESKPAK